MNGLLDELFSGSRPIGIVLFIALLFYVIMDIIKKSNRIDDLLKQLTLISKDLHDVRNAMQVERATWERVRRDVEDIMKNINPIRDRVIRLEARLKVPITEEGMDAH